jgi:MFS family permease
MTSGSAPRIKKRHIAAVLLSNAIEYYDFVVYAFFAVMIGKVFFPSDNPVTSLLLTMSTFAVGALVRPLGSIIIGGFADRRGRKAALLLTVVLMTISTIGIGATPSYESIGVAAPIIMVLARMAQGLAYGGQMGAATSFIAEIAPPHRRSLYMGAMGAINGIAILFAGILGFVLASTLSDQQLVSWGWRVPFLLGLAILPLGLYIWNYVPDSLIHGSTDVTEELPFKRLIRDHLATTVNAALAFGSLSITVYVTLYMTTYAVAVLKLPANIAMVGTLASGGISAVTTLAAGWLADRYGSRLVCIVPMTLLLVLPYPAFLWLVAEPSVVTLLAASAAIGIPAFASSLALLALLPRLLPASVRATGIAFSYAIATSFFGGTAQVIITWLVDWTKSPYVPAFYVMVANAVGLKAIIYLSGKATLSEAVSDLADREDSKASIRRH